MSEAPAPTHGALTSEQEYRLRNYAVGFDHLGWQNVKHSDVAALLAAYDAQAARLAEASAVVALYLADDPWLWPNAVTPEMIAMNERHLRAQAVVAVQAAGVVGAGEP